MSGRPGPVGVPGDGAARDLHAERERIRKEIEELERSLEPGGAAAAAACGLSSGTDDDDDDVEDDDSDSQAEMEGEREEDSSDDDIENSLPEDPETCLQMNHVYQEVIQEKIEEVELLIAQNREQQKEITWELGGPKPAKAGDGRSLPSNVFLGHFMKPYFKDKTTGIGPPSNEDAKEKAAQGIKSFEQLIATKWKSREKTLLHQSIVSDRLQRLLQPKLLKLEYWNQKLAKVKTEIEKQILEKQIKEAEREMEAINQLPESDLLGSRFDEHDWDKISNIHFDGHRNSEELRKFWQNWEHPSINKTEWSEEEIEKLKEIAADHNYLHWETIAQELGTSRTAFQCLQKYQAYNKDLKRKEWTKEEDQMLANLIQEMRVGSHIPYKKIAYYMEGRDSTQLIYRWTKSVDPSLRKGPWTPEEDAMLLAAVKKYGARDWYKIRTEVPGRSDAQCRDRYLKALHCDVKKGKWSLEEEEQLIELVEKHGLGHWSKIASELPHRTGSQCLSKWKLMIGSKEKRSRLRKHQESSSSPESSSEDTEEELEMTESSEEETEEKNKEEEKLVVPAIDLWIPTRTDSQGTNQGRSQTSSLFPYVSAEARMGSSDVPGALSEGGKAGAASKSAELNTILRGMAHPHSSDISVKNPLEEVTKASRCGKQVLRVSLENVRKVLRKNTYFQRKRQSKIVKPSATTSTEAPGVVRAVGQGPRGLQNSMEKTSRQERERWRRINLDRRLLMAVTPWVGNVLLPYTLHTGKMAFHHSKAEAIREKMRSISLTSTPLFTLFIQLFQIDTNGCMKVIRERKLRQLELLKASAQRPQQVPQNVETSSGDSSHPCAQRPSQKGIPKNTVRRPMVLKTRDSSMAVLESSGLALATQAAPPTHVQRQKPKTVSELLREKRLRESRASKSVQRPVFVAPPMLVSGPMIIQRPPHHVIPSAQVGNKLAAAACRSSQAQHVPLPAVTSVAGSASSTVVLENHSSAGPAPVQSPGSSQAAKAQANKELSEQSIGNSLGGGSFPDANPATVQKASNLGGGSVQLAAGSSAPVLLQNQAFVPQITVVPVGIESGNKNLSLCSPGPCRLNGDGTQQRQLNLLPALVTAQPGSHVVTNSVLPITWLVAPQALLPSSLQTLVGVQGLPAAAVRSQSQAGVTSNGSSSSGSGAAAVPGGAGVSPSSCTGTEAARPALPAAPLLGKAVGLNHPTLLLPASSGSPGWCPLTTATMPACPEGFSRASDSSAAQAAFPADGPALHTAVLPHMQPPASTQGSHSHCVLTATSLGKNSDPFALDGSPSTPAITGKATGLQPSGAVPQSSTPGTSQGVAAGVGKNRPLACKPPAAPATERPPRPAASSAEKNPLDWSLISLEDEAQVKEWLSGQRGVQVPSLQTRLPYLPPFLCNLKTLSKLLLQKAALEERAACLLPADSSRDEEPRDNLEAIRELVEQKLGDNPAYLLLKARFLAAFTLPAVLATLPPPKVTTTLSVSRKEYNESDEEEWQSGKEEAHEGSCGEDLPGEQLDGAAGAEPGHRDADLSNEDMETDEVASQGSCTDATAASAPQIRRSARFRKRKRTGEATC